MKNLRSSLIIGFAVGALVPGFWGLLSFILLNVPEGWFSHFYWGVVYVTCPFWQIDGEKALILMPLLNGSMYAAFALMFQGIRGVVSRPD